MNTASTISIWATLKNSSYVLLFLAGTEYLNLSTVSIEIYTLFIVADVVTGIAKSIALHGGKSVKSSIWERGLLAKCLIFFVPMLIALAGKGVNIETSTLAQGMVTVLIFSELYSIIGNIYAIKTGNEKQEWDPIAYILSQFKNVLKNIIKDDI